MTALFLTNFMNVLREWVDDFDVTDEMILSWIAMGEERINNELRVLEMVVTRRVQMADQCVPLPEDFLEIVSARYLEGGLPLRHVPSDEYFRVRSGAEYYLSGPQTTAITYLDPATGAPLGPLPRQPAFIDYPGRRGPQLPLSRNIYTVVGKTMHVHPTVATPSADIDPTEIELSYYATVPALVDAEEPTWLFKRAQKLYLYGSLAASAPYFIEDQRAQMWNENVQALIAGMNIAARQSAVISSPVTQQVRSFG
jgi:hypothetical protein